MKGRTSSARCGWRAHLALLAVRAASRESNKMDMPSRFDVDLDIIKLYLESAKTYMELSIALLGLTVVFREKVFGSEKLLRVQMSTICFWLSLLLSIGFNSLSQYAAVHFLGSMSRTQQGHFSPSGS